MVDKAKLRQRLMATFLDELDEHVTSINVELLSLEDARATGSDDPRLTNLFRAAHSLKGASRAVDLPAIEQVCHYAEDVFGGLRDGILEGSPELFSLLFESADAIGAAGQQLREFGKCDSSDLDALLPKLQSAAAAKKRAASVKSPPASTPMPSKPPARKTEQPHEDPGASPDRGTPDGATGPESRPAEPRPLSAGSEPSPAAPTPRGRTLRASVRVAQEKLDTLLAQSGELLVARQRVEGRPADLDQILELIARWKTDWRDLERLLRVVVAQGDTTTDGMAGRNHGRVRTMLQNTSGRIVEIEKQLDQFRRRLVADARQLKLASTEMQDDIHRIRMFPFVEACAGLNRAARDICRATDKEAELVIEGGDIEVDRTVLDGLGDPLLHLLRNAIDHGVERPEDREAAGKPRKAKVTVAASLQGSEVNVVVADDGRGLDPDRIRKRLLKRGLPVPANEQELQRSIFHPGFSTADIVTGVSGRGIGMDVVRSRIEELHGHVAIASEPGLGTRFTLSLPLTLTTVAALFVRVGAETFALPSMHVRRLVRFRPDELRTVQGRPALPLGEAPVPVISLRSVLKMTAPAKSVPNYVGVVVGFADNNLLFLVDEVLAEHEAVVKHLGHRIRHVRNVSGAIMLRSGDLALLLNVAGLVEAATTEMHRPDLPATQVAERLPECPRRVLVVDDSMTTRTLIKSILETAGYDVTAAPDGRAAFERLQDNPPEVVITDVDMPRMNGFELTQAIRDSPALKHLPVILITARETDEDKARGIAVGANAYLVKSSFDQTRILETVEQFV